MLGNYRAFFDFYNQRDNVCRQLLNIYIDKVRMRCLLMFSKTWIKDHFPVVGGNHWVG